MSVAIVAVVSGEAGVMWLCVVRGLMCIHPSFRIVALAEPPVVASTSQQWLNAEQLTMFLYHNMRSLSVDEELYILNKLVSYHVLVVFNLSANDRKFIISFNALMERLVICCWMV